MFSETQQKVVRSSQCTLLGALFLGLYSLALLVASLHMRNQEEGAEQHGPHHHNHHRGFFHHGHQDHEGHHHHHQEGPACQLHHFAILGLITSLTGIISAFRLNRGCALLFMVGVLILELSLLGFLAHQNVKAVHMCQARATDRKILVTETVDIKNHQIRADISAEVDVNRPELRECLDGVKHAAIVSSLIVGVAACALACCSSRFSNALGELQLEEMIKQQKSRKQSEGEEQQQQQEGESAPVVAIVIDQRPSFMMKEQPAPIIDEVELNDKVGEKQPML